VLLVADDVNNITASTPANARVWAQLGRPELQDFLDMASSTTDGLNGNSGNYFDEPEHSGSSIADQIDLQHYLRILRKHKWAITLFTALITCLAAYYAYTATPIYRSTSTLLIESQNEGVTPFEDLLAGDTTNTEYYQTQFELLKSRELAKRVIDKLGLQAHPEFLPRSEITNEAPLLNTENSGVSDTVVGVGTENSSTDTETADSILEQTKNQFGGLLDRVSGVWNGLSSSVQSADPVADAELSTVAIADPVDPLSSALSKDERERIVIQNFQEKLSVTPIRKTKLVKISFESADREFAAQVSDRYT